MVSFVMKRAQNVKSDVMVLWLLGGWYPIILIHYSETAVKLYMVAACKVQSDSPVSHSLLTLPVVTEILKEIKKS